MDLSGKYGSGSAAPMPLASVLEPLSRVAAGKIEMPVKREYVFLVIRDVVRCSGT